jgi:CubicO group peptidase (beta-lactamase class C family)
MLSLRQLAAILLLPAVLSLVVPAFADPTAQPQADPAPAAPAPAEPPAPADAALQGLAVPSGVYRGTLTVPQLGALELALHLGVDESGAWAALLDVPAQGVLGLPLRDVLVTPEAVRFTLDSPVGVATFDGLYDGTEHALKGTFRQNGLELPLVLAYDDAAQRTAEARAKLADFGPAMQKWLADWRVPGCAIGIVQDGQIVMAQGFGVKNLESHAPVGPDTLFAIGSVTKSFTVALLGQQVAAGKLDWDKPLREYLPDFRLHDEYATDHLTVRDMVTHRSGLPRHDGLWYGSPFDRAELVRRLRYLEPNHELREAWQYNNLMFLTAGYLDGVLAGSSWEEQVKLRLLDPLGMSTTAVTTPEYLASADHADGYWERPGGAPGQPGPVELLPLSDFQATAPAGSLCASVNDMLKWAQFQLGDGKWSGQELLPADQLAQMHTLQMAISAPPSNPRSPLQGYGMGWFISDYRGHYCVDHGGNIDGFSAMVRLFPFEKLGIVVLTNMAATPLTNIAAYGAADRLLGLDENDISGRQLAARQAQLAAAGQAASAAPARPAGKQPGAQPAHPLADYAGDYVHPGYGTAQLWVNADGKLALRFNGFDAVLDHSLFETFEVAEGNPLLLGTRLLFNTDVAGRIASLSVQLEPAVDPVVFTHQPQNPLTANPAFAAAVPGTYLLGGQSVTVSLRGGVLYVLVPGQPEYTLEPLGGLEFGLAGLPGYSMRFDFDVKAGKVTQAVFTQPDGNYAAVKQ